MTSYSIVRALRAAFPTCAIVRGWHLDGPGPARFGWAAVAPTGRACGRTLDSALAFVVGTINERAAAVITQMSLD